MRSSVVIQFPRGLRPGQVFASAAANAADYWSTRFPAHCELDASEGDERDRYQWRRYRDEYWCRLALEREYDGVRLRLGLSPVRYKHAVVVCRARGSIVEKLYVPISYRDARDVDRFHASHWWKMTLDYVEGRPSQLYYLIKPLSEVVRYVMPIGGRR